MPDLIQKVLKKQSPLHILGDGMQIRHYTYGADLAQGIVMAMQHPDAFNEDFNLSTAESTTVLDLAKLIWHKINNGIEFAAIYDEPFKHDVQKRIPAIDKAKRILNFEAKTSLNEMLDKVIPWIEDAIVKEII